MYSPYKVIVKVYSNSEDYVVISGYGKAQDKNIWADTAKRLLKEKLNLEPKFITSAGLGPRESVDDVPSDVKEGWPNTLKTIPVYLYTYTK